MKKITIVVPDNVIEDQLPHIHGKVLNVPLWYPRSESKINTIELDLVDVRAADCIRVIYDFDRDGWSILQASRHNYDDEGNEQDPDWQEVAFVQAWGRWEENLEQCEMGKIKI